MQVIDCDLQHQTPQEILQPVAPVSTECADRGGSSPVKAAVPLEVADLRHVRLRTSTAAAAAVARRQRRRPSPDMQELMYVSDGDRCPARAMHYGIMT